MRACEWRCEGLGHSRSTESRGPPVTEPMPTSFGAENGRSARVGLVGVLERPPFLDLFAPDVRSSSRTMTHAVRLAARRPLCARTHLPPRLALARLPPTPTPPAHVSSAQNVDGARAPPGTRHTVSGGHPASAIARPRALAALLTSWQCPPATEIPTETEVDNKRQAATNSNRPPGLRSPSTRTARERNMALRSRDPARRSAVAAGWVPRRCHSPCQALIDIRASPTSDIINTGWRPVASGRTYVCKWDGRAQPRANVRTSGTLQAEPCGERRPDRSARRSAAPRSWSRRLRTERSRSRHRRPVCLVRCCGSGGQRRDRVSGCQTSSPWNGPSRLPLPMPQLSPVAGCKNADAAHWGPAALSLRRRATMSMGVAGDRERHRATYCTRANVSARSAAFVGGCDATERRPRSAIASRAVLTSASPCCVVRTTAKFVRLRLVAAWATEYRMRNAGPGTWRR